MSRRVKPTPTEKASSQDAPVSDLRMEVITPRRLAFRLDEVAESLGISRRTIERERSAGRFPRPDLHIGKMPLWTPETIRRWVEGGGDR